MSVIMSAVIRAATVRQAKRKVKGAVNMKHSAKYQYFALTVVTTGMLVLSGCNNTSETAGIPESYEPQITTESAEEIAESVPETTPATPEASAPVKASAAEEAVSAEAVVETAPPETEDAVQEAGETAIASAESNSDTASGASPKPETVEYTYADMSKTMYARNSVNVRSLPSTSGAKLGSLKKNGEVAVTGQCNETGWYRIVYGDGEAFVSNKYLSDEKVAETTNSGGAGGVSQTASSVSTDFLTPDGYLNPNNPIVADAYAKYGENIAICEDGTVLDAATWQVLGKIDGVPGSNAGSETGSFDRAAAEEVWGYMNDERVSEGLNALAWDENIYNFACQRAQQLVTDFSHNGCGNYGENIEYQSGTTPNGLSIHMLWYLSPGHHSNYLNSSYGSGACAVYVYGGMIYAVENFALASDSGTSTAGTGEVNGEATGEVSSEPAETEGEVVGEIDYGTTWTASNGVSLSIRSDGLVAVLSDGHTSDECEAALKEYYETH